MNIQEEIIYTLALSRIKPLGLRKCKQLIELKGSAMAYFNEDPTTEQLECLGASLKQWHAIRQKANIKEAELLWDSYRSFGAHAYALADPAYPSALKEIDTPPALLFASQPFSLKGRRVISLVGTRKATFYGCSFVKELIYDLLPYDPVIISGLAYGIDVCAHRCALEAGLTTLAVVAGGLDHPYPKAHTKEREAIEKKGSILTESLLGVAPEKNLFPARNRIIAGLAEATIVVEAGKKSGALITAKYANQYNREVFALPGDRNKPYTKGTHALIKQHRAHLITSAKDLVYLLGWEEKEKFTQKLPVESLYDQLLDTLPPEAISIVHTLKEGAPRSLEELSLSTGYSIAQLHAILLPLEMKKIVDKLPDQRIRLCF